MLVKVETLEVSYRGGEVRVTKNDPAEMLINPKKIISAVPIGIANNNKLWMLYIEGLNDTICIDDNDLQKLI